MDYIPRHVRFGVSVTKDGVEYAPGRAFEVGEDIDVEWAIRLLRTGAAVPASDARFQGKVPKKVKEVVDTALRPRPALVRESQAPAPRPTPERYAPTKSETTRAPVVHEPNITVRRQAEPVEVTDDD